MDKETAVGIAICLGLLAALALVCLDWEHLFARGYTALTGLPAPPRPPPRTKWPRLEPWYPM